MLDGLGDPSEAVVVYMDSESLKVAAKVSHGWLRVLLAYRSQIEKRLAATIDALEKLCSAHRKEQVIDSILFFLFVLEEISVQIRTNKSILLGKDSLVSVSSK